MYNSVSEFDCQGITSADDQKELMKERVKEGRESDVMWLRKSQPECDQEKNEGEKIL